MTTTHLRPTLRPLLAGAFLALTAAASQAALVYSVDDGTQDFLIGFGGSAGLAITYANQFTVVAGGETIESISIVWGTYANGTPFTARLWSDPNGDGNPLDAIELASQASVMSLTNSATFSLYDIPDVTLAVGQNFFVGFTVTLPGVASGIIGADVSAPTADKGWFDSRSQLSNANRLVGFDPMIRANAVAAAPVGGGSPIPEPGTALFGAALLGMMGLNRRRRA